MKVRPFGLRRAFLLAAGIAAATSGVPAAAEAAPLSTAEFAALAARCAPSVPAATLQAVARTESALDPWALHDNTTGATEEPATPRAALADAWKWMGRGDSVDLGLMQINSANLPALDMTPRGALDACASLAGGAAVLKAAYAGGKTSAEQQAALLMALSRYNTGSPFKGILNGYARRVIANANEAIPEPPSSSLATGRTKGPTAPPSWNVWATAAYDRNHGAPWLIEASPAPASPPKAKKSPARQLATLHPQATMVATIQANSSTQPIQRIP